MAKRSPYSEMYLVSPAIWQRMLRTMDKADVSVMESLNKPMVEEEPKSMSEKVLHQIHQQEMINPQENITAQFENEDIQQQQQQQQQQPIVLEESMPIQQTITPVPGSSQQPISTNTNLLYQNPIPSTSSQFRDADKPVVPGVRDKCKTKLCQIQKSTPKAGRNRNKPCPHCGQIFSRSWNLARHISDIHSGIQENAPQKISGQDVPLPMEEESPLSSEDESMLEMEEEKKPTLAAFKAFKMSRDQDRMKRDVSFKPWAPVDRFGNVRKRRDNNLDILRKDPYAKKSFKSW